MSKEPVIVTKGLTRRFGDTVAVDGLTLEVAHGEVFGLLGHNGAGKTTTVRLLNGVLTPSEGSATVFGLSPMDDGPALRAQTGILTETPSLDERLTGRDNLSIYATLYNVPQGEVNGRVEQMLTDFELAGRGGEKVGGYSKGMKQRLALARAMLHEPKLLFFDEPTAGLDPVAARGVNERITHLSRDEGRTVLLATHNLIEAQKLCGRVAVLEHGRVVAMGTPGELAQQISGALRLEIEVAADQATLALDTLRGLGDYTGEITGEHDLITLVGAERESIPDMLAALVGKGVRVYRVSPHEPSLEDVYFALHRGKEKSS